MRKIIVVIAVILFGSVAFNAQEIEMKKVWGGYQFLQDGKMLNVKNMQEIMKNNQEALDLISSAKSNQNWALALGAAGGFLVGYPLGTSIGGGDPQWALAGAGAALIVASIPIIKGFNKKASKAVELYNAGISSTSYKFNPSFHFNIQGENMGIAMKF
ncbi:hypothetical protein [Polaribacter sp. R77954]|uniref:hypothetical protein n=1 Tax=Polaribacter sp. R77954 TaxID=3093870 RepID=UPI0037C5207C